MKSRFACSLVIAIAFGATSATAQVRRVDGCSLQAIATHVAEQSQRQGAPPATCGSLPVIEDAWTMDADCLGSAQDMLESETYRFAQFGPVNRQIVFVTKVKLPVPPDRAAPWTIVEDVVLLPCNPRTAQSPDGEDLAIGNPPPMILVDDVTFPPLLAGPEAAPATEFLLAFVMPASLLTDPFGVSGSLDWFAVIDFDTSGLKFGQPPTPDLDGNGCPDAAIELGVPGRFVPHTGVDDTGAALVEFLMNHQTLGLSRVDVFEPHGSSFVLPQLVGMQQGESGNSRPWCFDFVIGL
jgi:hypothetical protein